MRHQPVAVNALVGDRGEVASRCASRLRQDDDIGGLPPTGHRFDLGSRVALDVAATNAPGSIGELGWSGAAFSHGARRLNHRGSPERTARAALLPVAGRYFRAVALPEGTTFENQTEAVFGVNVAGSRARDLVQIAATAALLLSSDAAFVTSTDILVDGRYTVR